MLAMLASNDQQLGLIHVEGFIAHNKWAVEPKLDGIRVLASYDGSELSVVNRAGAELKRYRNRFPEDQALIALKQVQPGSYIDGELMADGTWCVFDIIPASPNRYLPLYERRKQLEQLFTELDAEMDKLRLVHHARTEKDKRQLIIEVYQRDGEGVIFKNINGEYESGRSRAMRKCKFTKTVDCVVMEVGIDGKDNAKVGVWVSKQLVDIGKVSTLNHDVDVEDVVEVRYLEVSKRGRLIQPVLLRVRLDKPGEECTFQQLEANTLTKQLNTAAFINAKEATA